MSEVEWGKYVSTASAFPFELAAFHPSFFEKRLLIDFSACAIDAGDAGSSAMGINEEKYRLSLVLPEFHGLVSPNPSVILRIADGKYFPLTNSFFWLCN